MRGTKIVSQLTDAGVFLSETIAYESPLEPGHFHIPAGAVDVAPPSIPGDKYAVWNGEEFIFYDIPTESV